MTGAATLPMLVAETARRQGERTALVDGATGDTVSYATLATRLESAAARLRAGGFRRGDALAVWGPNDPHWAIAALAAMAAGGHATGIPPGAMTQEAALQLTDAGATVVAAASPLLDAARAAAAEAGVQEVVALDELDRSESAPHADPSKPVVRVASGEKGRHDERSGLVEAAQPEPSAVALLPYSSGTTGLPKGVMLTHANVVAGARQIECVLALEPRDRMLALAPFAHVMGSVVTLAAPLIVGATVVTMPRFELAAMLGAIERHRITVLVVPPPVIAALARHPVDQHDLSALELVVSGGAPLGAALHEALAARLPHAALGQGYGLTETSVAISGPDGRKGGVPGSVGRVVPDTELRVVDPETGDDRGAGEPGELWVRGPQVMAGYKDRPEATAAMLDADGWLRTGDLGRVESDGTVWIVDRLKELIKVDALQVAPAELEALLVTHPAVADAAVIPRPDDRHGQVPVALVVPAGELDVEEVMAWVAARVARHKRLRAIRTVEAIPRTPSGKILRRLLVEPVAAAPQPEHAAAR
jgi:acyl-CoA synthetase (AMP-forming)/AMP-acid ligase II